MSAIKACPSCKQPVARRKKGCCPGCGVEIVPDGKRWQLKSEAGKPIALFDVWLTGISTRREAVGLPPLWFKKGSTAWIAELGYAKQMIAKAVEYLKLARRKEQDPTRFAIAVVQYILDDPGTVDWMLTHGAESIRSCNGKLFSSSAPRVLQAMESKRKESKLDSLFSGAAQFADMLRLG